MPPPARPRVEDIARRRAEIGQPRARPSGPEKHRLEEPRVRRRSRGQPVNGPPLTEFVIPQFRHPGGRRLPEAADRPIGRMRRHRPAENPVRPPMRIACRLRAVVAQKPHHPGRRDAASLRTQQCAGPAPALMPARQCRALAVGEDIGEIESLARRRQPMRLREPLGARAQPFEIRPDRVAVRNAALGRHPFHRPVAPHRFEHEGIARRIGDDEGIVIFEAALVGAIAALAV